MQPPIPRSRARRARTAVLAAAACLALTGAASPPEPLGIGDPLFPYLGNPGYDVSSYTVGFTYTGNNTKPMEAVTAIDAVATGALDRFNLDFANGTVRSVVVDGADAEFAVAGEDVVVTPRQAVPLGRPFHVVVRHTSDPSGPQVGGWVRTRDGLVMANQADAAHRVFPCNDHPADKANFTFQVVAPQELTVVANGLGGVRERRGGQALSVFSTSHPMAPELAQVSIGRSAVLRREGPGGLPVRDVVPTRDARGLERLLSRTPGHIAWMEKQVGSYPFEAYGVLVADAETGFELETQTLSLFERSLFARRDQPDWYVESIMVHELAHQWFGNSVSPHRWADLWLNEGHATWYESLFAQEFGGQPLEQRMRAAYADSDRWRVQGGPPAAPQSATGQIGIFRPVVYDGSALVLYALRQEVGEEAFAQVERRWVSEHRDGVATTTDFTRLASEVAGRDLTDFFEGWLYGAKTPPMPGHPDWRSEPVD
ncbi:M1 family metallopeptidase [Streptomyces sp. S.PB5]|uniref:M1 family metallopeptidase n=1 Tax=Streptomyces sp. S.PB5 TaxID=3020844 RepID=UPI0025B18063|nr:M1 family metallopeptidase [Streptomyces sp. S.PB5]MDN3022753.1 M1 family metallopeptidase [Streptomyces sp. S.PB5]